MTDNKIGSSKDEPMDPSQFIVFGKTTLQDYSMDELLGQGTYGKVHKCTHIPSGIKVAIKTFLFEVSNSFYINFWVECVEWDKLLYFERDLIAEKSESIHSFHQITRCYKGRKDKVETNLLRVWALRVNSFLVSYWAEEEGSFANWEHLRTP